MERRLYRSRRDRIIAGVCGGIAEQMQIDPTLVRVVVVVLTLLTQGAPVLAYIVMVIVVPEEPFPAENPAAPADGHAAVLPKGEMTMPDENEPREAQTPPPAPEVPSAPPATYVTPPVAPEHAQVPVPAPTRGRRGSVGFGVVLVVIGVALLANQFIPDFDAWRYWPVAIILIGVATVFKGLSR